MPNHVCFLTCFHLTNLFFSARCLIKTKPGFSSITLFIKYRVLNFSSPGKCAKWKQVKITNMILQRLQVFCRFFHIFWEGRSLKFDEIFIFIWNYLLCLGVSKNIGDFVSFLWPSQNIWTYLLPISDFNFWPSYTDFLWKNSMHCLHWSCL